MGQHILFVLGERVVWSAEEDGGDQQISIGDRVENAKRKSIQPKADGHIVRFCLTPIELRSDSR